MNFKEGPANVPTPEPMGAEFKALLESGITALESKFTANQESFSARPDIVGAFDVGESEHVVPLDQIPQMLRRSVDKFIAESAARSLNPDIERWVFPGFSKGSFHRIFRAESSLTSYPSEDSHWQRIAECVHEAGEFIRSLAIPAGYEIRFPKLFDSPPDGVNVYRDEDSRYIRIPEIKSHVRGILLRDLQSGGLRQFVVSVNSFPVSLEGTKYDGRVTIANPSNWLQN